MIINNSIWFSSILDLILNDITYSDIEALFSMLVVPVERQFYHTYSSTRLMKIELKCAKKRGSLTSWDVYFEMDKSGTRRNKKKTYHSNGLLNKQNTPCHLCGICDVFSWCSSTFQLRQRQSVNEIVKIIATLWISFYLFSLALHCMRCTRKWCLCQQLLAPNIVIWTYNKI